MRSDDATIDSLFYDETEYPAIRVEAGQVLGKFSATSFAIDMVMDSFFAEPNLGIVRRNDVENIMDVSGTGLSAAQIKSKREGILNYLDPCAFFGSFYSNAKKVIDIDDDAALYNDIISKFTNRNRVYIDIRNENGFSLNHYDNYGSTIRRRCDKIFSSPLSNDDSVNYSTNSWPIHIIEKLTGGGGNNYYRQIAPIRLQLPTGSGGIWHNKKQVIYFSWALQPKLTRKGTPKTGWFTKWPQSALLKPFVDIKSDDTAAWTNDNLVLATYNHTGSYSPICTYHRLMYINDYAPQPTGSNSVVATSHHLDNLFIIKDLQEYKKWQGSPTSQWYLTGHEKFISYSVNGIVIFEAIFEAGVAFDANRVVFFAVPKVFRNNKIERKVRRQLEGRAMASDVLRLLNNGAIDGLELIIGKVLISSGLYGIRLNQTLSAGYTERSFLAVAFTKDEFEEVVEPVVSNQSTFHPLFVRLKDSAFNITSGSPPFNYFTAGVEIVGYGSTGLTHSNTVV
ncbi:MAG: hypothetical protein FGM41_05530, partial [Bacteroidetes bacterium]|nr:hypothetical protein [Bacteroidota bacterium]